MWEPIKRASGIWTTDNGIVLGHEKGYEGSALIIENDTEDCRYEAVFGVMEDMVFRPFCSVVYCNKSRLECPFAHADVACRYCTMDGRPRPKEMEGRYYVNI